MPWRQAQRLGRHLQPPVDLPSVRRFDRVLDSALLLQKRIHLLLIESLRETRAYSIELVEQALDFLDSLLDVSAHIRRVVQRRFLWQVSHANPCLRPCFPMMIPVQPGHDAQKRRLSGPVQTQHTDFRARKERQRDVFQDFTLGRHHLGDAVHGVDVLGHGVRADEYPSASPSPGRIGSRQRTRRCARNASPPRRPLQCLRRPPRNLQSEDCRHTPGTSVAGGTLHG